MKRTMTEKEKLLNNYEYEIKDWLPIFGSAPIAEIKHADYSEAYVMCTAHVFQLENGQCAVVIEEGCSCYTPDQAGIELFKDAKDAIAKFDQWEHEQKSLDN